MFKKGDKVVFIKVPDKEKFSYLYDGLKINNIYIVHHVVLSGNISFFYIEGIKPFLDTNYFIKLSQYRKLKLKKLLEC